MSNQVHTTIGLAMAGLLLAVNLGCGGGSVTAPQGSSQTKIAFGSRGDIYLVNPDGSGLAKVIDADYDLCEPSFSPDGHSLVYTNTNRGLILTATIDGRESTLHIAPGGVRQPSYHPSGQAVVFAAGTASTDTSLYGLYRMEIATGQVTQLMEVQGALSAPVYEPSGNSIVYAYHGTLSGIYRLDLTTGQVSQLIGPYCDNPAPSPDGTRIAFQNSDGLGNVGIWVMDPDGSNAHVIFRGCGDEGASTPWFTSDGRAILFLIPQGAVMMNADGSSATPVPVPLTGLPIDNARISGSIAPLTGPGFCVSYRFLDVSTTVEGGLSDRFGTTSTALAINDDGYFAGNVSTVDAGHAYRARVTLDASGNPIATVINEYGLNSIIAGMDANGVGAGTVQVPVQYSWEAEPTMEVHATLFSSGGAGDLGTLSLDIPGAPPGFPDKIHGHSEAYAISPNGEWIVGMSNEYDPDAKNPAHSLDWPVYWHNGIVKLGFPPGHDNFRAAGVGDNGQIIGWADQDNYIYTPGSGFTRFDPGYGPRAISGTGQVVGMDSNRAHGFTWRAGAYTDLDALAGDDPCYDVTAVNDEGAILAFSREKLLIYDANHDGVYQTAERQNLAVLLAEPPPPPPGQSEPRSLSDLNFISHGGWIAGESIWDSQGNGHAFVLVPQFTSVPVP